MKIAMPVNNKDPNSKIFSVFGRAPFFIVFDDTKNISYIDNDNTLKSGAGIGAAQSLAENNVDVLIVENIGPKAEEILQQFNIKIVKIDATQIDSCKKICDQYAKGEL